MNASPIWLCENEVVGLLDLPDAIDALEAGLAQEAAGAAANMSKTHVSYGRGDTLHAIGAVFESEGLVAAKTWVHTEGGATPLLIVWSAQTGALLAVIEAFALGQMRTGAMSGVATRWMARPDANVFALVGTGKQALSQLAAVAAVRELTEVRIFGRDRERRQAMAAAAEALGLGFSIEHTDDIERALRGAEIITLVTRAKSAFVDRAMIAPGVHINAVGAITPEREEIARDVLEDADLVAVDDPLAARKLSRELMQFFGDDWSGLTKISAIVASAAKRKPSAISVFKAMGMGVSDLALGAEVLRRARAAGVGRAFAAPARAKPRLVRETKG